MYRNLKAWFLRRLDVLFLTEDQRRLPRDELRRIRVVVGAAALNLVMAVSNMLGPEPPANGPLFKSLGLVFSASYLGTLLLVRRVSSVRPPALLLCSTLTVGVALAVRLIGTPEMASHASIMLVPALAVYLLGARLGLIFTVLMGLNVLVFDPLSRGGGEQGHLFFADEHARFAAIAAAVSLLGGWMLSWFYSFAGEDTHAALRESESRLISLIESTDDLVCSFDMQGVIITANPSVKRVFKKAAGREFTQGESLFSLLPPEKIAFWKERITRAFSGQSLRFEVNTSLDGKHAVLEVRLNPIIGVEGSPVGVTLFGRDITTRKEAEDRLGELHRSLLEVSRQAGKAEIATSVLHNVGNTLNSVTVSVGLVADKARGLRLSGVAGVARLLQENAKELYAFLNADPRGRKLPAYMEVLADLLNEQQERLVEEVESLRKAVEHIQAVVTVQQEQARPAGLLELVPVAQLIDDALRLQGMSFQRVGIQVQTQYASVPLVLVDRHKLLQILVNLLSNARHSLLESAHTDKQLALRVGPASPGKLRIEVADNGVGILPENLPRIFTQGFTTKKEGHGFGLHLSALTTKELGGSLTCDSKGKGHGATFTLELPLEPAEVMA